MNCNSCGRRLPDHIYHCARCGAEARPGGGATSGNADRRQLVTDGGEGPDDEDGDPLAPAGDEGEDGSAADTGDAGGDDQPGDEGGDTDSGDNEGEYLEPDDIVGEELDDGGGQPGTESPSGGPPSDPPPEESGTADQPAQGEPSDQSPRREPSDRQPQDQPSDRQPQGQPSDRQPQGEPTDQPPKGQPTDQPAQGQPTDRMSQGSSPQAGGPGQGTEAGGKQPGEQAEEQAAARGTGATADEPTVADQIKEFPLLLGGLFGAAAAVIPFVILSALTIVARSEESVTISQDGSVTTLDGLDVAAEIYFSMLQFGSGERILDIFLRAADTDLLAVDPADYSNWQSELVVLLGNNANGLLFDTPEAPFLILYIITPYVLFVGARYLARHYAPGETVAHDVGAGVTVTLGILPVVLVLGLVFTTTELLFPLVLGGLAMPLVLGTLGGVSVSIFDEYSPLISTFFGWGTIVFGILLGVVLKPIPSGFDGTVTTSPSIMERFVVGMAGYLDVLQFNLSLGIEGFVLLFAAILTIVGAGFLRTWMSREEVPDVLNGARVGASVFLGFFGAIALLLWVYPLAIVFVDLSGGFEAVARFYLRSIVGDAGEYLLSVVVAGFVVPMFLGAVGGIAAKGLHQQNQRNRGQYQQQQGSSAPHE